MNVEEIKVRKQILGTEIIKLMNDFIAKTNLHDVNVSASNNFVMSDGGNVLHNQIEVEITINI